MKHTPYAQTTFLHTFVYPYDGGKRIILNICTPLPDYMAAQSKSQQTSEPQPNELQTSQNLFTLYMQ